MNARVSTVVAALVAALFQFAGLAETGRAADRPEALPPIVQPGSKAVTYYYLSPDPKVATQLLDDMLKKENLEHPWFRARSDVPHLFATSVGLIARGKPEIVRQCEARFEGTTPAGRRLVLQILRVCGDKATLDQIDKWLAAEEDAAVRKDLQAARALVADPNRKQARDKMPATPHEMDLLWADFFATGEYEPVARILDVLDLPAEKSNPVMRGTAAWSLRSNMSQHPKLVELLRKNVAQRPEPSRQVVKECLQKYPERAKE